MSDPHIWQAWASQNTEVAIKVLVGAVNRKQCIQIHNQLQQGMASGETIRQSTSRTQDILHCDRETAERVTTKVVGAVMSESRFMGAQEAGLTHKSWVCARSPVPVLPGHMDAEERYRDDPIPIEEPLIVNGLGLRFPREFLCGKPEECIDCQCLAVAKMR